VPERGLRETETGFSASIARWTSLLDRKALEELFF